MGFVDFKKGSHRAKRPILPYENLKIEHDVFSEIENSIAKGNAY